MTDVVLVQPPPRVDLVEIVQDPSGKLRGRITRPWQMYLDDFFTRAGGSVATSNDDLAGLADAANLGIYQQRQTPPQIPGIGEFRAFSQHIQLPQEPPSISYVQSFLPRRQEQTAPLSDASAVICSRVFAKR